METFADYLKKSNSFNFLYRTLERNGIDASIDVMDCQIIAPIDYTKYMDELSTKTTNKKLPQFDHTFLNIDISKLILTQRDVYINKVMKLISEFPRWAKEPLVVYQHEGNLYLQDGHHRFAALYFLREKEYPCQIFKANPLANTYNATI